MESKTTTFYAVRIVCIRKDGKPAPTYWVCPCWHNRNQYALDCWNPRVTRFNHRAEAKRALKYAVVRDILRSEWVKCPELRLALQERYGDRYNPHWHGHGRVQCRYEAEAVKITETTTYSEPEVIDALPKRSALEQIARQAEN